jgi:hypothetical protein
VVFEVVPPFRGVRVRSDKPILDRAGAQQVRTEIAARYLGEKRRKRFAAERASPGILLRLPWEGAKTWDLTPILPSSPPWPGMPRRTGRFVDAVVTITPGTGRGARGHRECTG